MSGSNNGARTFPDLRELGFISDRAGTTLVQGANVWWLDPRMGGETVFTALLGADDAFRVGPDGVDEPEEQGYVDSTLVSKTTWRTDTGVLVVHDALAIAADGSARHILLRYIECTEGEVAVQARVQPRFAYGRYPVTWQTAPAGQDGLSVDGFIAEDEENGLKLTMATDLDHTTVEGGVVTADRLLREGEKAFVAMAWGELPPPGNADEASRLLKETTRWWGTWSEMYTVPDHPLGRLMAHHLTILSGLQCWETGAIMAASTTSLPEDLQGVRNWEYRKAWLRDATIMALVLAQYGRPEVAERLLEFFRRCIDEHGWLIMYGLYGEKDMPEEILDHLPGYENSYPVQKGNAAVDQPQHDMTAYFLRLMKAVWGRVKRPDMALWGLVCDAVEIAKTNRRLPDHGIWEIRDQLQFFVTSQMGVWETLKLASELAEQWGKRTLAAEWAKEAEEVRKWILRYGVRKGVLRAAIKPRGIPADTLDASVLMAPLIGFLSPDDPRVGKTLKAIRKELGRDGGRFIDRYDPTRFKDGLPGDEGAFLFTTFISIAVEAQVAKAKLDVEMYREVKAWFDGIVGLAHPGYGVLSEEYDTEAERFVGNTPQGFSSAGVIWAAQALIDAEQALIDAGELAPSAL